MITLALLLIAAPVACFVYAYAIYPAALWIVSPLRPRPREWPDPAEWPTITIIIPAYNEERVIGATLDALLAIDYPADRRQIVVVSDASSDGTDAIVASYAARGVELLRMPQRSGKSAAENAVAAVCRGDILVNTDASIRIQRHSLKPLLRVFQDPTVGVASGRDVSVGDERAEANAGESRYVGYEMWVRAMETRLGSIVGASGCFYAIRKQFHDTRLPPALVRDFAGVLIAREQGYRAVSVDAATAVVPRTSSLQVEYRRKIRTMVGGIHTLWYKRHLMNPFRYGGFAIMLVSHKLCRWLFYLLLPAAALGLVLLAARVPVAALLLLAALVALALGIVGMRWPAGRRVPTLFALPGFIVASNVAGMLAWLKVLRGERAVVWEPTRRPL
jgi:cellulose synthase/poly-beta-1,6-N-acetylglucosamine synthase-like glycosyltransferase